ncbi:MAG TPA: hypothetical protein VF631_11030 [Allosphingosinicella sp.]|jgi:hypothetical protein|uniref:hypothetical protein n=1 Tax=Allosphingosinicella sp. TaxID=2823234 RepID=UPI002F2A8FC3
MSGDKYAVFGLVIESEIALPELLPAPDGATPDVAIRVGNAGEEPLISAEEVNLVVPKVASYRIRGGREIVFAPREGASERNIRLFLLGSAFGAIIHQRGLLPLHANAIDISGRAVAFMGHSGAGKSTMAAWFLDRGHRILADDVCVVVPDAAGVPLAYPGIPRLRLWREALERSGRNADELELAFDDMDKFNLPTPRPSQSGPIPLSHVYLLEKAEDQASQIQPLSGVAAVDALVANTYRGGYLARMGGTKRHLLACLHLVKRVPVFRASRLWGFDGYDEEAERLEQHARSLVGREAPIKQPA